MPPPAGVRSDVPLAPFTTLEIGGPARWFAECDSPTQVGELLGWARAQAHAVLVLGGGSNLVVSDAGFDGLVIRLASDALHVQRSGAPEGEHVDVTVEAGVAWDALVARCVHEGWAGLECLSGIPGTVGAAPIQNIGAYGQELADALRAVHTLDRHTLQPVTLSAAACGFGYRHSAFKANPTGHVVTGLVVRLRAGGAPTLAYRDLHEAFAGRGTAPTLAETRAAVLRIRAAKSMVLDPTDPNRRSVGSFFMNPLLGRDEIDALRARLGHAGIDPASLPTWPLDATVTKTSAAWLIERAGFTRGMGDGAVGVSTQHTLALVNRGGARASEIVAFAAQIRRRVEASFGVRLHPEPTFIGFERLPWESA